MTHLAISPPAWWESRYYDTDAPDPEPSWLLTYEDGTEEYIEPDDLEDYITDAGNQSISLRLIFTSAN